MREELTKKAHSASKDWSAAPFYDKISSFKWTLGCEYLCTSDEEMDPLDQKNSPKVPKDLKTLASKDS